MPIRKQPASISRPATAPRPLRVRNVGALRAVQPRAQATRDAMLVAGRMLLADRDYDTLAIADIAAATGLSVGSFYGRFRDKASFFALLQEQAATEWLEAARLVLRTPKDPHHSIQYIVSNIAATTVGVFRRDGGLIRAALKHASAHPGSWTPVQRTAALFVDEMADVLAPHLSHLPKTGRRHRVRFAMQMLFGTAVNAVLNDPGPLRLADPALEQELARAVCAYLELDPPERMAPH